MMRTSLFRRVVGVLAAPLFVACGWLATPTEALAAPADPPSRLLVEIPEDAQVVDEGATIAVQVVGESADGARVGFPGHTVELTASVGKIEVVKRPFKFRFVAPKGLTKSVLVTLSAQLEGAPSIQGKTTLRVRAANADTTKRAYKQLIVRAAQSEVPMGGSLEIEILGDTGEGAAAPVTEQRITLIPRGKADPAGSVVDLGSGKFRYNAPDRGSAYAPGETIELVAALASDGNVQGTTTLTLTRRKRDVPVPDKPKTDVPDKLRPDPVPPGGKDKNDDDDENDDKGLLLSSKFVRIMVWRTKETPAETFKNDRKFPEDGTHFIAPSPYHKMRFVVLRNDVVEVNVAWYIGNKKGAKIHVLKETKDGALRTNRNKQNRLVVHLELDTPDNKKPVHAELRLKLANGRTLLQPLTLLRGHDKDRDGQRDKGK